MANDIILIVSGCSAQAAAKAGLMDPVHAKELCGAGLKRVCELAGHPARAAHGLLRGYLPYDDPGLRAVAKDSGPEHLPASRRGLRTRSG